MDQIDDEGTHDRCDCHVCATLRNVLSANLDAPHDRRVATTLLLTFAQAAEILGIGEAAVRAFVSGGEIRAVTVQTYGRQRIPRVEIDEYVARLLTGQLRAWVEARRDLEQWGLRYMGDKRTYTDRNGRRSDRTVAWHLGDGKTTLCGITKERWSLPDRRPRARPCGVCQKVAGIEARGPAADGLPPMVTGRGGGTR
jgi:excisionase family DNA binding protein